MRARTMVSTAFAALLASCIDYTGLGENGSGYTKPSAVDSFDCSYRNSLSNQAGALSYCEGLGGGYRLVTKDEALAIAANPSLCRSGLPSSWATWTSTSAGAGLAWFVYGGVGTPQYDVAANDVSNNALCVR